MQEHKEKARFMILMTEFIEEARVESIATHTRVIECKLNGNAQTMYE